MDERLLSGDPLESLDEQDAVDARFESLKKTLTPREAKVIALRFGLDGETPHSVWEVAKQMAIREQRVREIESKAVGMHHHRRQRPLKDFLD